MAGQLEIGCGCVIEREHQTKTICGFLVTENN